MWWEIYLLLSQSLSLLCLTLLRKMGILSGWNLRMFSASCRRSPYIDLLSNINYRHLVFGITFWLVYNRSIQDHWSISPSFSSFLSVIFKTWKVTILTTSSDFRWILKPSKNINSQPSSPLGIRPYPHLEYRPFDPPPYPFPIPESKPYSKTAFYQAISKPQGQTWPVNSINTSWSNFGTLIDSKKIHC